MSTDSGNMVEVKYIVTLQEDVISSEIVISNSKSSSIRLTGCVLSDFGQKNEFGSTQLLNQIAFWRSGSQNNDDEKNSNQRSEEEIEGEETDNYKHLRDQMSLIYTSAPRNLTVIDNFLFCICYVTGQKKLSGSSKRRI